VTLDVLVAPPATKLEMLNFQTWGTFVRGISDLRR
jgi:hypothetical protein